MHPIDDDKYKQVVSDALTTAQEMLSQNSLIMNKILGDDNETSFINEGVIENIGNTKNRFQNGMALNPAESATINRALVEYLQKVELAQSHFLYSVKNNSDLEPFREAIKNIHMAQMRFSFEQSQEMAQNMALSNRVRPQQNRP